MQRRDVTVDGATISTAAAGDGPPVVLLPGMTMSIERWVDVGYVDPLVGVGRQVIAMDPLGHGRSSKSAAPDDYTEDRLIAHVVGVLDAYGLGRADLWGYSRGAQMAGSVARVVPDRVRRLVYGGNVLFDPAPVLAALDMAPDPVELERAFDRSLAGDWQAFWEHFPLPLPDATKRDIEERNDLASVAAAARSMSLAPVVWSPPTAVPTLAIWGAGEIFHDLNLEAAAQQRIEHATVPGGHAEAFDPPGPMLEVVLPWLAAQT